MVFQAYSLQGRDCFSYSFLMSIAEMSARESEVLQTALTILKEALDPPRIILFGSRAEGRHGRASDFDFAVDVAKPLAGKSLEIRDAVNDAIGLYKADILFLPNVEPEFRDLILSTGKVVYERQG
jgi:predicted nucleotidyltransferase